MKVFTYSEARQHLADLLELAESEGAVRIRRRDGRSFTLTRERETTSPLEGIGIRAPVGLETLLSALEETRGRHG